MSTEIRIIQGNQIGGCITVISTDVSKIVIDFGESLPGTEIVENIEFDWENEKVDAVFFTHYHGDHIGRFAEIPENVKIYMGEVTHKILSNLYRRIHSDSLLETLDNRKNLYYIEENHSVCIGDVIVTPYTVDHSAYDAYMFLVETPDKRILHTGDYRDHGHRGHVKKDGVDISVMLKVIEHYIKNYGEKEVNILITEGTLMGDRKNQPIYSEKQLMTDAKKIFSEHKYVFLKISSTNVDSLASFYQAAKSNNMGFYVNSYQYSQIEVFRTKASKYKGNLYSFDKVWVLKPQSHRESTDSDKRFKFERQREHMHQNGFLALISENDDAIIEEFREMNPILIYSMWDGYINEEKGGCAYNPKLTAFCKKYGAISMHTSGHAYPAFIEDVINTVNPTEQILPIHTENAKGFTNLELNETLREKIRYE